VKRILLGVAYGVAGLAFVGLLTLGAFALAGEVLSEPARPVRLPEDDKLIRQGPTPDAEPTHSEPGDEDRNGTKPTETPSGNGDEDSGDSGSGDDRDDNSGSDDDRDDNSGSGSDDSGSGSDSSGSGLGDGSDDDNSGSGSDSSGSGSGDDSDHDSGDD